MSIEWKKFKDDEYPARDEKVLVKEKDDSVFLATFRFSLSGFVWLTEDGEEYLRDVEEDDEWSDLEDA